MSASKTVINLYNPGEKRKDDLINEFVIRKREFENIFNDIKSSKMEHSEQPYLLVGQRGSGKSTLIQRLRYAIEDDPQLSSWLIPITFTEEQYNITELGDLWIRIAEYLEDYHDIPGIVSEMEKQFESKAPEAKQFDVLTRYLQDHKKKIIIFIDNIGDLLKKFKDIEVKRLRTVLQSSAELRLIAASPVMLDEVEEYQKALFQYFKTIRLGGLDREEMETLLRHLGDRYNSREAIDKIISDTPERIEIMRRLTGGIVRTVVMMYNIFVENVEGSPISDLYKLLDEATPLYKHKMDDLPVQQQKIVDAVAKNWDAITSGELSKILRMPSSSISAQLRQLEKDQWIEKIETNTKNHLYELQERFFNIWYLMRNGRKYEKNRVMWFVKFMEALLEKDEIERRIEGLVKEFKDGKVDKESMEFWLPIYCESKLISAIPKVNLLKSGFESDNLDLNTFFSESIYDFFANPQKGDKKQLKEFLMSFSSEGEVQHLICLLAFSDTIYKGASSSYWLEVLREMSNDDKDGFIHCLIYLLLRNNDSSDAYRSMALGYPVLLLQILNTAFAFGFKAHEELITNFKINEKYKDFIFTNMVEAIRLLFHNKINESWDKLLFVIKNMQDELVKTHLTLLPFGNYIQLLIAKYQYQYTYQLMMNEKLKLNETDRPLYYALMHYMRDEYPNEYLRMPPEMKETTEDIIKKIEAFRAQDKVVASTAE